METGSSGVDLEQIPHDFLCCICLDLLYKPVVLACGHMSCFWCVHRSMNGARVSHCPICRDPYYHFPTICELLHILLVKTYPETCKRRHSQILVEEKENDCFSPVFCSSYQDNDANSLNRTSGSAEGINTVDIEGSSLSETNYSEAYQRISVKDVLCAACNQLLFQPSVLNCGHVLCSSCITPAADRSVQTVCQVCQRPDPRGYPKVCLAFDNFLVGQFPKEYAMRKESVQLKQANSEGHCAEHNARGVHRGVGCDFCGMCPIVGDRYRCVDCKEKIGFDLCQYCHDSHLKIPGRFNQQHTSEHKFEHLQMPNHQNGSTIFILHEYDIPSAAADPDPDDETHDSGNTQ